MNAPATSPLRALVGRWHSAADELRRFGAENQAAAIDRCAKELEDLVNDGDNEALTYAQAALETGLTVDHIGRLVGAGELQNVGRRHVPRIRRGELAQRQASPRKARALRSEPSGATSRVQIARSVVHSDQERSDG